MLFAGGMAEASPEDLFAHETRQNFGPLQMRKKPPEVLFSARKRQFFEEAEGEEGDSRER